MKINTIKSLARALSAALFISGVIGWSGVAMAADAPAPNKDCNPAADFCSPFSAADNPAYLVILQNMEGQSRGYEQAIRNAQDTTSMLYTAEGAAGDSSAVLQDMRALSVQAGDGTLTDQDRSYIQAQMTQLGSQLTANANGANFNGMATNDGSLVGFRTEPKIYEIKYEPSLIVKQKDEKTELNTNKEVLYNYNDEIYVKKWIAAEGNKFTNGININYGVIYEDSDIQYDKLILNR